MRPAGAALLTGEVIGVDLAARTVEYRGIDSGTVRYDALVVALGAALDTAGVPGLDAAIDAGVAGEFYSVPGAAQLHSRIADLESGRVLVLITAVPFKCPPAPYEAAFLIADLLGQRFRDGAVAVDLFTCEPRPIGVARSEVSRAVVGLLGSAGIGFAEGKRVRAIDSGARTVSFDDDSTEAFDVLAVVPPHTSPAAALLPELVNPAGWIPVDPATLATAAPGVWAVGDCTALPLANGLALPKAGIFAEGGALVAADQVTRFLGYDAPDARLRGEGGCLMVVGGGQAAKIAGHFLAEPEPQVGFFGPNAEFFAEKEAQERDWLARG